MEAAEIVLLAAAGFVAGAVNAVAGGGSLISFPALLAVGYAPVTANVTNTVALLPGYGGAAYAMRSELRGQRRRAIVLGAVSAAGGLAGAVLLLAGPDRVFEAIVPFLILFGAALLAFGPWLKRRFGGDRRSGADGPGPGLVAAAGAAAVYGGYFGAGVGIVLLGMLSSGIADTLHRLNALKQVMSTAIVVASAALFVVLGPVAWPAVATVAATSFVGGHVGAAISRHVSELALRAFAVLVGLLTAAWLLVHGA